MEEFRSLVSKNDVLEYRDMSILITLSAIFLLSSFQFIVANK